MFIFEPREKKKKKKEEEEEKSEYVMISVWRVHPFLAVNGTFKSNY